MNRACFQAIAAMSRGPKKSRRHSPRARTKMLAPRMTVLSTSKNAAAVGSGAAEGVAAASGSAGAAPATTVGAPTGRMPVSSIGPA